MKTRAITFPAKEAPGVIQRIKRWFAQYVPTLPELTIITPERLGQSPCPGERRLVVGGKIITVKNKH